MRNFSDQRLLSYTQRLSRLRYLTIVFLFILLMPLGILLTFGFQQFEKDLMIEYQSEASHLIQSVNKVLLKRRMLSSTLPVDAFDYYQQVYNPITRQSQQLLSPLSQSDPTQSTSKPIKGLVGYFQYNRQGHFNSPIWPYSLQDKNIDDTVNSELEPNLDRKLLIRRKTAFTIYQIMSESKSIQQMIQQEVVKQGPLFRIVFDVPNYFIFYRFISVAGQIKLQGYLVERQPYLSQLFAHKLGQSQFGSSVLLTINEVENSIKAEYFFSQHLPDGQIKVSQPLPFDKRYLQQTIFKKKLSWPYEGYELAVSTNSLPITPAMVYSIIFIMILIAAILFACYGFYHLGIKQLALGEQRLNFVSSVSHELKTPLTSIRMYSQMLNEGTVISETDKKDYYEFIYGESERLTRLINNILQLSTLSNQQQNAQTEYTQLPVLQDIIRSKTSSIIEKGGFEQNMIMEITNAKDMSVLVDPDAFAQIVINITDNAVKFFDHHQINDHTREKIDFIFRQHPQDKHKLQLEIRDYGAGITQQQESKIFDLFYRGGNELTRTTQGTGIGLALVNELVLAQQGGVKVEKREPGLAMLLSFYTKY